HLKKLLRHRPSRVLYVDHIQTRRQSCFFQNIYDLDLEGIVAKRKDSRYRATEKPSRDWIKIKNPKYSQLEGRKECWSRTRNLSYMGSLSICCHAHRTNCYVNYF